MPGLRQWLKDRTSRSDRTKPNAPPSAAPLPSPRYSNERKTHPSSDSSHQQIDEHCDISLDWTPSPKRDGQRVSFLDLPRELRDNVYQHSLIMDQPFDIGNYDMKASGKRHWVFPMWNRYPKAPNLLSTCKQIHAEAAPVLYGDNAFETSLSEESAANRDLLTIDENVEEGNAKPNATERLRALPFHPMYRPLVGSRSFRFGSGWQRDAGVKFLLPMMKHLRDIEGAFFRAQSLRGPSRWVLRNDIFVAGWRRKGFEKPLSAHNKHDCGESFARDYVASSDDVLLAISKMSESSSTEYRAQAVVQDLLFNVHVHGCLLDGSDVELDESGIDQILSVHSKRILKVIYIITPYRAVE